ncbi:holin [Jeotgalibacillus proteolyticus]|uniref:Holin n=1 Tax=Jeotgalibacillus proteolyticus TaxID=2082395 RepID=A0A2S5GHD8_9BACL|nr:holin [Jeotgalibacillus proteolyticus]PPA72467.1 holin [Jeotgalibacillus proteolyticus]
MEAVLLFATILAPIVLALIEVAKKTGPIPKNLLPLIALAMGIFIGFAASPFTDLDTTLRMWAGGFAGLSATGLFEIGKKRSGLTKEDI